MYYRKKLEKEVRHTTERPVKKRQTEVEVLDLLKLQKIAGNSVTVEILETLLAEDDNLIKVREDSKNLPLPEHLKTIDSNRKQKLSKYEPGIEQKRLRKEPDKFMELSMSNGYIEGGVDKDNNTTIIAALKNTSGQTVNHDYMKKVRSESEEDVKVDEYRLLKQKKEDSATALLLGQTKNASEVTEVIKIVLDKGVSSTYNKLFSFFSVSPEVDRIRFLKDRLNKVHEYQTRMNLYLNKSKPSSSGKQFLSEIKERLKRIEDDISYGIDRNMEIIKKKNYVKSVMIKNLTYVFNRSGQLKLAREFFPQIAKEVEAFLDQYSDENSNDSFKETNKANV